MTAILVHSYTLFIHYSVVFSGVHCSPSLYNIAQYAYMNNTFYDIIYNLNNVIYLIYKIIIHYATLCLTVCIFLYFLLCICA